jgi:hypothetical protein
MRTRCQTLLSYQLAPLHPGRADAGYDGDLGQDADYLAGKLARHGGLNPYVPPAYPNDVSLRVGSRASHVLDPFSAQLQHL